MGWGPFNLVKILTQVNQPLNGQSHGTYWLVVYTLTDSNEVLEVLYTIPLVLRADVAPLSVPAPPTVSASLTKGQEDTFLGTGTRLSYEEAARALSDATEAAARVAADNALQDAFSTQFQPN